MPDYNLIKFDLENKFPLNTFSHEAVGDGYTAKAVVTDGGAPFKQGSFRVDIYDAYKNLQDKVFDGEAVETFRLTSAQASSITNLRELVYVNHDTGSIDCYNGSGFAVVGGTAWQLREGTTVQTTDDTQTTIDSFTLDDEETYMVQINVVGTKSDGSDRAGSIKSALLYRDGGGVATIQGVEGVTLEEYSDSNWDISITVSGNDVRASVTGVAATTINWTCSLQFIEQ